MSTADTLVVGLGSIGNRHARLLHDMGRRVATVSRRAEGTYESIEHALGACKPDYIVVATETSRHAEDLHSIGRAGYRNKILVEKPIFTSMADASSPSTARLHVGYNLRFHPVISELRRVLPEERTLAASAYVGQNLKSWRPERDYRKTSSASRAAGGGVLRDLSHELDLLLWLLGSWQGVVGLSQNTRTLEIDVEDSMALLLRMERCGQVSLSMNYLDHSTHRTMRFVQETRTIVADLVASTLTVGQDVRKFPLARDETYITMHSAALNDGEGLCGWDEGLEVVRLMEAAENSIATHGWVLR